MKTCLLLVSLVTSGTYASQALVSAAEQNDTAAVQACLDKDEGVNQTDEYGATALYHACFNGNEPLVVLLLAAGADPMVLPTNGAVTPLYVAAHRRAWSIVERLLRAGADSTVRGELDVCPPVPDALKKEFGLVEVL